MATWRSTAELRPHPSVWWGGTSGAPRAWPRSRRGGPQDRAARPEHRTPLATGAHAAAPRSATSAGEQAGGAIVRHEAGAYDGVLRRRQEGGAGERVRAETRRRGGQAERPDPAGCGRLLCRGGRGAGFTRRPEGPEGAAAGRQAEASRWPLSGDAASLLPGRASSASRRPVDRAGPFGSFGPSGGKAASPSGRAAEGKANAAGCPCCRGG